jgi:hypothetical protein
MAVLLWTCHVESAERGLRGQDKTGARSLGGRIPRVKAGDSCVVIARAGTASRMNRRTRPGVASHEILRGPSFGERAWPASYARFGLGGASSPGLAGFASLWPSVRCPR